MKTKSEKQHPDTTLESVLVKLGFDVRCMWQKAGAPEDGWAWLEMLSISGGPNDMPRGPGAAPHSMVIVQTFKDGGWDCYRGSHTNSTVETIRQVMLDTNADPMKRLAEIDVAIKEGTAFAKSR